MAKIIFFSPHSLVWEWAFPNAIVAESLMKSKHDIVFITCGGALNAACVCLTLNGVKEDSPEVKRTQVCHQCTLRAQLIRQEMKLSGYSLSSQEEAGDERKIQSIMGGLTAANFSEFQIEDVPIGRIAVYEYMMNRKKMNADFTEVEWQQFYPHLKSAIKAFFILQRIFSKENPDYTVSYNSLYSVNAVCAYLARKKGVVPYFMQAGLNFSNMFQNLFIGQDTTLFYYRDMINHWPKFKNIPCNEELLLDVTDYFLELLRGKSNYVYSAPKLKYVFDLRKNFGITPEQKILVATLSSYDEIFTAEFVGAWPKSKNLLFKMQTDWVQALIEWIKDKTQYFLIIRVHPREFPNKRESVKSEHADIMQKLFVNLPKNVRVNWPEDRLSVYDLACETDVFLNAWSSVGQEMTLLGLPVVIYSKELLVYPADINYLGETTNEYFAQIEQALKDGWSFDRIRMAFRWYSMLFGRSQIRIDDSYRGPVKQEDNRNWIQRQFNYRMQKLFPLPEERQECRRRSKDLKSAALLDQVFTKGMKTTFDAVNMQNDTVPTFEEETVYIKNEMMRIAKVMWGGIDKIQDGQEGKLFLHFKNYFTSQKVNKTLVVK